MAMLKFSFTALACLQDVFKQRNI